ncbi:MAG: endonuclease/exonuclease/phosphatase family protein, partial [Alkalispirochaeta sp.]
MTHRIMTYNAHGGVGTDGVYDPERIGRVIGEVAPDILGLQEVRRNTADQAGVGVIEVIHRELPAYQVLFLKTLTDER